MGHPGDEILGLFGHSVYKTPKPIRIEPTSEVTEVNLVLKANEKEWNLQTSLKGLTLKIFCQFLVHKYIQEQYNFSQIAMLNSSKTFHHILEIDCIVNLDGQKTLEQKASALVQPKIVHMF